jgi:hypothetical protein
VDNEYEQERNGSEQRKFMAKKAIRDVFMLNKFEAMDRMHRKLNRDFEQMDRLGTELRNLQSEVSKKLKNEFLNFDADLRFM